MDAKNKSKSSVDSGPSTPAVRLKTSEHPPASNRSPGAAANSTTPKLLGTPKQPVPAKRGDFYIYTRGEEGWLSGKLWYELWEFRPEGYAVASGYSRTVLIDRSERELGSVYIFDNYPDSVQDGVIRMRQGKKVRYFSLKDGVYLKGAWDFGTPFDRGVACVCNDCLVPDGDYNRVEGGVSWFINDKGKILRSYTNPIPQCDIHPRKDTKEWVRFVDHSE